MIIRASFFALFLYAVSSLALFPFDSIFVMNTDVLAVEAEDCYAGEFWVFDQAFPGYTGRGYMRYTGPEAICLDPGQTDANSPTDEDNRCQSDIRARLRIPVRITKRAFYNINARCYAETDGVGPDSHASGRDHTAWIMVEELLDSRATGSGHTEFGARNRWTWFAFGPGSNTSPDGQVGFGLEPGDYVFYLGGRHRNFRADRIHIYPKIGLNSYPQSDTVATLQSAQKVLYADATVTTIARQGRLPVPRGVALQRFTLDGRTAQFPHTSGNSAQRLHAVYLVLFDNAAAGLELR